MRHKFCRTVVGTLALPLVAIAFSAAQIPCPAMPDNITQVNHDVLVDVNASVGSLGKLKAGEIGVKTDVVAKNLFERYPNADRVLVVQMMTATYCPMIRDDKTLKDADKRHLWSEFSDRIFKFENPAYIPSPKAASNKNKQASSSQQSGGNGMSQECAPGANCAMSNGQQGGVTAGTYIAGPQLWKLSGKDSDKLAEKFKELGTPNCVILTARESDSKDLGQQVCRASPGAMCETPENIPTIAGTAHGLECYANSSTNHDLLGVEAALLSVGLRCAYKGDHFSGGGLQLCVGMRAVSVAIGDMPEKPAPEASKHP